MENKENKSIGDKVGNAVFIMVILVFLWEGIKWFHRKFGIVGDVILVGFLIYLVYFQKPVKFKGNPPRTDIHLIK